MGFYYKIYDKIYQRNFFLQNCNLGNFIFGESYNYGFFPRIRNWIQVTQKDRIGPDPDPDSQHCL